ncbi:MAG: sulfotransferase family protein [Atribacterota bacterium]
MIDPVFIVGCSRTGSKIYMKILNEYSPINITPELHFLAPSWIRKDFVSKVKVNIGDLEKDSNIPKLIDLMYSGQLDGSFWSSIENRNLDKKKLQNQIIKSDRSFKSIFGILLEGHAKSKDKTNPGAKFPVHFSYIRKLLEWYPNCKIVHLIRDPRAMYASNALGHSKKSRSNLVSNLIRLKILLFTIIQFIWAVRIHKKYLHLENYCLFKFEDIISQPEEFIPKLCQFLEIEFKSEMLHPPVMGSSYHKMEKRGFDKQTLCRWRKHVSPVTTSLIKLITGKQMKEIGYL